MHNFVNLFINDDWRRNLKWKLSRHDLTSKYFKALWFRKSFTQKSLQMNLEVVENKLVIEKLYFEKIPLNLFFIENIC